MRTKKHSAANATGLFLNWLGANIVIGVKNVGVIAHHAGQYVGAQAQELVLGVKGVNTARNHRRRTAS